MTGFPRKSIAEPLQIFPRKSRLVYGLNVLLEMMGFHHCRQYDVNPGSSQNCIQDSIGQRTGSLKFLPE